MSARENYNQYRKELHTVSEAAIMHSLAKPAYLKNTVSFIIRNIHRYDDDVLAMMAAAPGIKGCIDEEFGKANKEQIDKLHNAVIEELKERNT